jgi:O-antigen/teichoic acid export membrane protein
MGVIAKNMLALLGSQVATWIMTSLMLIVVPRYLGDQQFGQLNVAAALVGFFGLFASLGNGQFIVKQVARDGARLGPYVFNALLVSIVLAIPLCGAALGTAYLLGYSARTTGIVAVACGGMALTAANGALLAGLQGQQRMGQAAVWTVVDRYASGAAVLVALVTRRGLLAVAMATFWYGWASLLGNGAQLFRQLRDGARLDLRLWRVLVLGSAPFMLWSLVLLVYGSIDVVMLSKMANNAAVGWYALAYRLVGIPVFLATIVVAAYFPQLSAYSASRSPLFVSLTNRAVRLVFFAGAPMATGIALIAGDLIAFFHYPRGFVHSIPLIWILALHIPVVGITTVLGAALLASDQQRQWVIVGGIAAVFNPLLNLYAIPATSTAFGDGAVGASMVTVATEYLMLGGALYLLRSTGIPDRHTVSFVGRCIVACVVMGGVVFECHGAWLPVRIVAGALAYGLVSFVLGTFPVSELRHGVLHVRTIVRPSNAPSIP